ncbi:MAG: hypothetical protein QNJ64_07410 [Crocosphaera sp.]|nr:hypothetical protein [Crocosphaera sp.]
MIWIWLLFLLLFIIFSLVSLEFASTIVFIFSALLLLGVPIIMNYRKYNNDEPPIKISGFLRSLILFRIPIISGFILFLFPIISVVVFPEFLENIFVMSSIQQLVIALVSAFLASMAIMSVIKTIAILRYPHLDKNKGFLKSIILLNFLLYLPSWLVLLALNRTANLEGFNLLFDIFLQGLKISSLRFLVAVIIAIAIIIMILVLLIKPELEQSLKKQKYNDLLARRIKIAIQEIMVSLTIYMIIVYLNFPQKYNDNLSYFLLAPKKWINSHFFLKNWNPPTLVYAFAIIVIMTILLAGVTYYWDLFFDEWQCKEDSNNVIVMDLTSFFSNFDNPLFKFIGSFIDQLMSSRFPVILFLIIFSASSYGFFQVDHYFKLNESGRQIKLEEYQPTLRRAIGKRLCPDEFEIGIHEHCDSEQSLVVVAASGGGIQASGWMAQVLGGLQEKIGEDFTKKTALISSVSGGSVGTMFYLDNLENRILSNPSEMIKDATEDWLGSVGWGLAFPDLFRFIGLWGPLTLLNENNRFIDRGYALEKSWESDLQNKNQTLDDWYDKIVQADIPIPIFNATLVENGRRFLISPMKLIKRDMPHYLKAVNTQGTNGNGDNIKEAKALDLKTLFNCGTPEAPKQCNLSITTAARLSASFPYVSPLSRNYIDYGKNKQQDQDSLENIFKDPEEEQRFKEKKFTEEKFKDATEEEKRNYKVNCLKKRDKEIDQESYEKICIKQNYHIADGGYFDNGGTFTAIERLDKFLNLTEKPKDYKNNKLTEKLENDQKNKVTKDKDENLNDSYSLNIKKIVLLNINAFPEAPLNAQQEGSLGYVTSGLGAVNTLNSVRDATQIARNIKEADLLKRTWCNRGITKEITIETFTISFPYAKINRNGEQGEPYDPPLSWRLTDKQKNNLKEAWETDPTIIQTVADMKTFWEESNDLASKRCDIFSKSDNPSSTIKTVAN